MREGTARGRYFGKRRADARTLPAIANDLRIFGCQGAGTPAGGCPDGDAVVGVAGFEPATSSLSGMRSNQLSYTPGFGGADRSRTDDLLNANQALSQLSYSPVRGGRPGGGWLDVGGRLRRHAISALVDSEQESAGRLEPRPLTELLGAEGPTIRVSLRKEVIQPQVLLRLPCYDFTPIMNHTVSRCLPKVGPRISSTIHFRDVTGGVYKARERIHGAVLMRHY